MQQDDSGTSIEELIEKVKQEMCLVAVCVNYLFD